MSTTPDAPLPGPLLLKLRRHCADQVIEPRPGESRVTFWGAAGALRARVEVTRGALAYRWRIRIPGEGSPGFARTGRALTCRRAWASAAAALPQLTNEQWGEVAAEPNTGTGRCGVTGEVPLNPPEPTGALGRLGLLPRLPATRVFVCDREAGHDGISHAGPLLHPSGPGDEGLSAEWPRGDREYALVDTAATGRTWHGAEHPDRAATGTYPALERAAAQALETEQGHVRDLTAEVARLGEALRVCEIAVHHTTIIGGADTTDAATAALLHAAQQASGAYGTDWEPGQQTRDDNPNPAGTGAVTHTATTGPEPVN